MEALRKYAVVRKKGTVQFNNLPFKSGQRVEAILLPVEGNDSGGFITGKELAKSDIVGLWKSRKIADSTAYARVLRRKAERRVA